MKSFRCLAFFVCLLVVCLIPSLSHAPPGLGGPGYRLFRANGTDLPSRPTVNMFGGIVCTDDSTNFETDCVASGSSNVYDVVSYGAVCDGNTANAAANTTAIQAAIDACEANGGGVVAFPAGDQTTGEGECYINNTLTLKTPNSYTTCHLVGSGPRSTGIRMTPQFNADCLRIGGPDGQCEFSQDTTCTDASDCSGVGGGSCVNLVTQNNRIEHIWFRDCETGVRLTNTLSNILENVVIYASGDRGVVLEGQTEHNMLRNVQVFGTHADGIAIGQLIPFPTQCGAVSGTFNLAEAQKTLMSKVLVSDSCNEGGGITAPEDCAGIRIEAGTSTDCGGDQSTNNVLIEHAVLELNDRHGVYIGPGASNITINHITTEPYGKAGKCSEDGVTICDEDLDCTGTCEGGFDGIYITANGTIDISNAVITNASQDAIPYRNNIQAVSGHLSLRDSVLTGGATFGPYMSDLYLSSGASATIQNVSVTHNTPRVEWVSTQTTGSGLSVDTTSPSKAQQETVIHQLMDNNGNIVISNYAGVSNQILTAGGVIEADACGGVKPVSSSADVVTSLTDTFTAPAFANGGDGTQPSCVMHVCNVNSTTPPNDYTITLDTQGASGRFRSRGSRDIILQANDCVTVGTNGGSWYQMSDPPADNYKSTYNALTYGFVTGTTAADGATNDAAMTSLLSIIQGAGIPATVFFPAGQYRFDTTILLEDVPPIRWEGEYGPLVLGVHSQQLQSGTTLINDAAGPLFIVSDQNVGGSPDTSVMDFVNLQIYCQDTVNDVGIQWEEGQNDGAGGKIEQVTFRDCGIGLHCIPTTPGNTSCFELDIYKSRFYSGTAGAVGLEYDGTNASGTAAMRIHETIFRNLDTCLLLENGANVRIEGSMFESCTQGAIRMEGGTANFSLTGSHFENNGATSGNDIYYDVRDCTVGGGTCTAGACASSTCCVGGTYANFMCGTTGETFLIQDNTFGAMGGTADTHILVADDARLDHAVFVNNSFDDTTSVQVGSMTGAQTWTFLGNTMTALDFCNNESPCVTAGNAFNGTVCAWGNLVGGQFENSGCYHPHGVLSSDPQFILEDGATPSVADGNVFRTAGTTAITQFNNGKQGQVITIYANSARPITHDGTNITLTAGQSYTMAVGDVITLMQTDEDEWVEVGRSSTSALNVPSVFNVAAYGAVCDGSTDDQTAVAATIVAACAAGGGVVQFPAGTCVLASALTTLCSDLTIRGAGRGATTLNYTASVGACTNEGDSALFDYSSATAGLTFRDLTITSNITAASLTGDCRGHSAIYLSGTEDLLITNTEIFNFGGRSVVINDSDTIRIDNNWFYSSYQGGVLVKGGRDVLFANNLVENMFPEDTDSNGIYDVEFGDGLATGASATRGTERVQFIGNIVDGCVRAGLLTEGSTTYPTTGVNYSGNTVRNCGIGNPVETGAGIWVENTTGAVTISGSTLINNKLGISITQDNATGQDITATISGGTIESDNVNLPTGQSASLSGGIASRATSTVITGINMEIDGHTDNELRAAIICNVCQSMELSGSNISIIEMDRVFEFSDSGAGTVPDASVAIVGNTFEDINLNALDRSFFSYTGTSKDIDEILIGSNLFQNITTDADATTGFFDLWSATTLDRLIVSDNVFRSTSTDFELMNPGPAGEFTFVGNTVEAPSNTLGGRTLRIEGSPMEFVVANNFFNTATQSKIGVDGGATNTTGVIEGNFFSGASSRHVRVITGSDILIQNNRSRDATSEAYALSAAASDCFIAHNIADEATLWTDLGTGNYANGNFINGSYSGLSVAADGDIYFITADTQRLRVRSNGDVQIASGAFVAPTANAILEIYHDSANQPGFVIRDNAGRTLQLFHDSNSSALDATLPYLSSANSNNVRLSTGTAGGELYLDGNGDIVFYNGVSERMRIDSATGNTTHAGQFLLGAGSAATPAYSFNGTGYESMGMFSSGEDVLSFATSGLLRMTLTSSGQTDFFYDVRIDNANDLVLYEADVNGTNFASHRAVSALTNDTVFEWFDGNATCAAGEVLEVANVAAGVVTLECDVDNTGGGTANSFETWNVPLGTDPVASSATDTMTVTAGTGIDITGTAATDTVDFSLSLPLNVGGLFFDFGTTSISTSDEFTFRLAPFAGTITQIDCESYTGTSFEIRVCRGEDRGDDTCTTNILDPVASTTLTCTTSGATDSTLNSATFTAREKMTIVVVNVTGTVTQGEVFFTGTVN